MRRDMGLKTAFADLEPGVADSLVLEFARDGASRNPGPTCVRESAVFLFGGGILP